MGKDVPKEDKRDKPPVINRKERRRITAEKGRLEGLLARGHRLGPKVLTSLRLMNSL